MGCSWTSGYPYAEVRSAVPLCEAGKIRAVRRFTGTGEGSAKREAQIFGGSRRWSQCSSEHRHVRPCQLCGRGSLQTVRLAGDGTGEIMS